MCLVYHIVIPSVKLANDNFSQKGPGLARSGMDGEVRVLKIIR